MRKWFLVVALAVAAGVGLFVRFNSPRRPASRAERAASEIPPPSVHAPASPGSGALTKHGSPDATGAAAADSTALLSALAPTSAAVAAHSSAAGAARGSSAPDFSEPAPEAVLENARAAFRDFRALFNGNPVGTNPEITAALNGGNPKQAKFIRETDGLRINEKGELIDPWGTPFFFHQLSAREMEIHCAGPDRVMWTADDLVIR